MNTKLLAIAMSALLVVTGGAAAVTTGGSMQAGDDPATATNAPSDVDAQATYENGTVTVTVTADGEPVENVTVEADDTEATTGPNGATTFETDGEDEVELSFEHDGFEGEQEYLVQDGSLTLVEEEYEYDVEEAEESEEAEDEEDAEEAEEEEESEEAEDDGDEEDDEDEESEEEAEDDESEDEDDDDDGDD